MDKDKRVELLKHILIDEALIKIRRREAGKLMDFNECLSIYFLQKTN
jgi:hypothetical protein